MAAKPRAAAATQPRVAPPAREPEPPASASTTPAAHAGRAAAFSFGDIPIYPPPPPIVIGRADDPLERDAERAAEHVLAATTAPVTAPGRGSRACDVCSGGSVPLQRNTAHGATPAGALVAPAIVLRTLASPGQPLDGATRAYFEPRFGREFSQVRVHSDPDAAASAQAVGALAYTVANHVVLTRPADRRLLAHELAHVAQGPGNVLRRYAPCAPLLAMPDVVPVPEADVRTVVAEEARHLGNTVEEELPILGLSAAPFRTEAPPGSRRDVISPQVIGDDIYGRVDIAVLSGTVLDLIEVKRATWGDLVFGDLQVANYVEKGNAALTDVKRAWRRRGHPDDRITAVREMPMSRMIVPSPQPIGGVPVNIAWCDDGLLGFKAMAPPPVPVRQRQPAEQRAPARARPRLATRRPRIIWGDPDFGDLINQIMDSQVPEGFEWTVAIDSYLFDAVQADRSQQRMRPMVVDPRGAPFIQVEAPLVGIAVILAPIEAGIVFVLLLEVLPLLIAAVAELAASVAVSVASALVETLGSLVKLVQLTAAAAAAATSLVVQMGTASAATAERAIKPLVGRNIFLIRQLGSNETAPKPDSETTEGSQKFRNIVHVSGRPS